MKNVFHQLEEDYRWKVYEDTWGHLAPQKNRTYRGAVTIAFGLYDSGYLSPTIIEESGLPDGSPWWHTAIHKYLEDLVEENEHSAEWDSGYVLRLSVTFRNYRFWLTKTEVLVRPASGS